MSVSKQQAELILIIVCCMAINGCRPNDSTSRTHSNVERVTQCRITTSHLWVVDWGTKDQEVVYVAISGKRLPTDDVEGIVGAKGAGKGEGGRVGKEQERIYIKKPDGQTIDVSGEVRLFELIDGLYSESGERITIDEWKRFLASKPETYSIRAILDFVKALRRTDAKPGN